MDLNDKNELKSLLKGLYEAQKRASFADRTIQVFTEKIKLTEEEAVEMLYKMIEEGWLVVNKYKIKFLKRPGYALNFPVVISKKGLKIVKEGKENT
ncbi:hypothetical protein M1N04_01575 [Peptococcaceae bacterium]|nr:hypothetical protein [Peptococcaceae bacterium]